MKDGAESTGPQSLRPHYRHVGISVSRSCSFTVYVIAVSEHCGVLSVHLRAPQVCKTRQIYQLHPLGCLIVAATAVIRSSGGQVCKLNIYIISEFRVLTGALRPVTVVHCITVCVLALCADVVFPSDQGSWRALRGQRAVGRSVITRVHHRSLRYTRSCPVLSTEA